MSQPTIVVHWLELSRAQRILWLLEELNLEYTLKLYKRNDHKRAPDELKKIHPLGKSPIVEVDYGNGKKKVLAESGFIISYLIKHFDTQGKLKPATEDDEEQVEYYLHLTEGTLQPPITMLSVLSVGDSKAPFMIRSVIQKYNATLRESYNFLEINMVLEQLEKDISKSGGPYFVGGKLSAADIALVYPVAQVCLLSKRVAEGVDKKKYPNLLKWSEQITNSPGFKTSVQKVEQLGKGKFAIHQDEAK